MESLKFIHESGRKLPRRKHSLRHTTLPLAPALLSPWRKLELVEKDRFLRLLVGQKSWNRKFRGETWVEDYRPGQGRGKIEVGSRGNSRLGEKLGSRKVVEGDRWKD